MKTNKDFLNINFYELNVFFIYAIISMRFHLFILSVNNI